MGVTAHGTQHRPSSNYKDGRGRLALKGGGERIGQARRTKASYPLSRLRREENWPRKTAPELGK